MTVNYMYVYSKTESNECSYDGLTTPLSHTSHLADAFDTEERAVFAAGHLVLGEDDAASGGNTGEEMGETLAPGLLVVKRLRLPHGRRPLPLERQTCGGDRRARHLQAPPLLRRRFVKVVPNAKEEFWVRGGVREAVRLVRRRVIHRALRLGLLPHRNLHEMVHVRVRVVRRRLRLWPLLTVHVHRGEGWEANRHVFAILSENPTNTLTLCQVDALASLDNARFSMRVLNLDRTIQDEYPLIEIGRLPLLSKTALRLDVRDTRGGLPVGGASRELLDLNLVRDGHNSRWLEHARHSLSLLDCVCVLGLACYEPCFRLPLGAIALKEGSSVLRKPARAREKSFRMRRPRDLGFLAAAAPPPRVALPAPPPGGVRGERRFSDELATSERSSGSWSAPRTTELIRTATISSSAAPEP
mmetsp:Transcript_13472/g.44394  ORF Transcript_13472/g.44394 Transcript_13472/m.44394 type:complete len:414 (+) Transcript_13472:2072-3313(+)